MTLAARLSDFACRTSYADFPPETVHEMKRRVIDSLGCALGALKAPPVKAARALARSHAGRPAATILWSRQRVTPEFACFVNGAMVRYLDFNDTYLSKEPAHPSDNLAPALAMAEALGRSGKEFLTALLIAYETQCRLCDAASLRVRGWDHVTYGAFSSALAAGKLLRLSRPQMTHALGMAGVANVALRQTRVGEISMWKACAFANAARNGIFAARLAAAGLTGPSEIFEGEKGFCRLVSGPLRLPGLGRPGRSMIHKTYIKFYPVEYHAQSAVEAALRIRRRVEDPKRIRSVLVETFDVAVEIIGGEKEKWRPEHRETADHSLPYCVAAALKDGRMDLAQFAAKTIRSPDMRRWTAKVRVRASRRLNRGYPAVLPNRVTVWTADGRRLSEEVWAPRGHAKNPMTDREVEDKFRALADGVLSPRQTREVLRRLWRLEGATNMQEFMKTLPSL
jgi:2-methylcitrate dehydratase